MPKPQAKINTKVLPQIPLPTPSSPRYEGPMRPFIVPAPTLDRIREHVDDEANSFPRRFCDLLQKSQDQVDSTKSMLKDLPMDDIERVMPQTVKALLTPISTCLYLLEGLAHAHPGLVILASAVKLIVEMEMGRQENDKQIAALYFTISDMIVNLGYLEPAFAHKDGLQRTLLDLVGNITHTIKDFGNFCDVYYKHPWLVRAIAYKKFQSKLDKFNSIFTTQKTQLLNLQVSKTVKIAVDMNTKIEGLSRLMESKTIEEYRVIEAVRTVPGGADQVLKNEELLQKVAERVSLEVTNDVRQAIKTDLNEALEKNSQKYNMQFDFMLEEMRNTLQPLAQVVAHGQGYHALVQDSDIKLVWEDMKWRYSCETRQFVHAIQNHFHKSLTVGSHDFWTLQYISRATNYAAIGDAIDQDGLGYISVYDVNRFVSRKPKEWSLPEWLAFWAVGWQRNLSNYQARCESAFQRILDGIGGIHPRNEEALELSEYLSEEHGIHALREIFSSVFASSTGQSVRHELEALRQEFMKMETERIAGQLKSAKYQIDSPAMTMAITSSRLESSFACMVHLVLQHHLKIVNIACDYAIAEEEFSIMAKSVKHILEAFMHRYACLISAWKQLRIDVERQAATFAGGLFHQWWQINGASPISSSIISDDTCSDSGSCIGSSADLNQSPISDDSPSFLFGSLSNSHPIPIPISFTSSSSSSGRGLIDPKEAKNILMYPLPTQPTEAETNFERERMRITNGIDVQPNMTQMPQMTDAEHIKNMEKKIDELQTLLRELISSPILRTPSLPSPTPESFRTKVNNWNHGLPGFGHGTKSNITSPRMSRAMSRQQSAYSTASFQTAKTKF